MPSSIHSCSVRSHVPVTVLLTSPLSASTAYNGVVLPRLSQISLRVMQPPLVLPSADSTYSRFDPEEYRSETGALESQSGLEIALFGEEVSAASARLPAARRPMIADVRSIDAVVVVVEVIIICAACFCFLLRWLYGSNFRSMLGR